MVNIYCNNKEINSILVFVNFSDEFRNRTKKFAIEIVKLFRKLPKTDDAQILGKQLLRSATSVAANYRAACRARSKAEFIAKLGIVVEEADESVFWLEIMTETDILDIHKVDHLMKEADELMKISSSARKTARENHAASKIK